MNIDVTYDASVANAPTGFTTVVADVVQFYDSQFADPITLNIDVGWGEVDGQSLDAKALGESDSNYTATSYDYAQIRAALTSSAVTAEAAGAVATLPTADPTGGGVFSLTTAEAKALGLAGASAATDGWVGFSSAPGTFDFSVTQNSGAVATNEYDLFGVVAHEFSEVMGRQMNFGAHGDVFEPLDMFDYSAPGVRSFNASAASRYYSVDGGVSDMFDFNTDPKGDLFDFSAGDDVADAFDAFAPAGVVNPVGIGDLTLMDVIGYVPTPIFAIAGPSLNGETLSFQIADQSQGPAPASAAGIYVSTNLDAAPTTADTLLASYSTPAIAGGGSAHATTVLPLSTLAPGAYILDVIADANGAVVQSSSRSDASNRLAIGILDNANLTALQADQLSNFDLAGLDLTGFFSFNDLYVAAAVNGPGTLEAGGTVVFGPGASLSVAEFRVFSGTEVDVQTDLAYAGFWNQQLGPVRVDAGAILDLTGSGNVIESAIGGPGALAFSGGSTAFGSYGGSTNNSLTVANVAVSGPTTQVSVAINLAYAGAWTQSAGTLTVAGGDTVTFTGAGDSFSGTVAGAGTVIFAGGSDTLAGAAISAAHVYVAGGAVTLSGAITDTGVIATSGGASLTVAAAGASLTGTGVLDLAETAVSQIIGAAPSATLTNASEIAGGGRLGAGKLTLVNQAAGIIVANGTKVFAIDTGSNTITNAGLILATGTGGITIASALNNTGHLAVNGGPITVTGAVTGPGYGEVVSGTLKFAGTFNENVVFTGGSTGTLELAHSIGYAGRIQGLSTTGANGLSLDDIGFTGVTTAAYKGTTTSGVLTVTDGTHTARINLIGDYVGQGFTTSLGAGGVGTRIVDDPSLIHWASQVSGGFATAADWIGGVVPGPANAAILDAPGSTAYTVTASASQTVASIRTAPTATLVITGGVFDAASGTGGGADAGTIAVGAGATLKIGGAFDNAGVVSFDGGATLMVAAGGATLTGTGTVELGAASRLTGSTAAAALTNAGATIEGAGQLGAGKLVLINQAAGVIASEGAVALTIDTGANTITNAGLIVAEGAGGMTIASAIANTGGLAVDGGPMTVMGDVGGSGYGEVVSGTLKFAGAFNQNVVFTAGSTGTLELAHGQTYGGAIDGLSTTGANALDLDDITFAQGTTTAIFSGSATSGVLTVTDGTHTARINLDGDYLGSTFTTSLGVGGIGTRIVDPAAPVPAPAHVFIAAMAALGAESAGSVSWTGDPPHIARPMLVSPRAA